jgi:DNA-binding ferritin-like protein (Dps family)
MPHVEILFNPIQKRNIDSNEIYKYTNDFAAAMKRIRKNMSNSSVTEMEDPVATRNAWIWT